MGWHQSLMRKVGAPMLLAALGDGEAWVTIEDQSIRVRVIPGHGIAQRQDETSGDRQTNREVETQTVHLARTTTSGEDWTPTMGMKLKLDEGALWTVDRIAGVGGGLHVVDVKRPHLKNVQVAGRTREGSR